MTQPPHWHPRQRKLDGLTPFAMSVAAATFGVGLMYWLLLPRLTAISAQGGQGPPDLTALAITAGRWWLFSAIVLGALAAWFARAAASEQERLGSRLLLQALLLIDTLMVAVSLAGFYASIVNLSAGFG